MNLSGAFELKNTKQKKRQCSLVRIEVSVFRFIMPEKVISFVELSYV